jgi:hypothetical protein
VFLRQFVALTSDPGRSVQRKYVYDEWGQVIGGWDSLPFSNKDRVRWKGALMMAPRSGGAGCTTCGIGGMNRTPGGS